MNKKSLLSICCLFLFVLGMPFFAFSTQLQPWFEANERIDFRTAYTYRDDPRLSIAGHDVPFHSNVNFLDLSASLAPIPPYCFEIETIMADTRERSFGLDHVRFTGRYQLMDDVSGADPISMTAGVTLSRATRVAVRDISSFHHGRSEYEFHLAAGKEASCCGFWHTHFWGLAGVGLSHGGSPWLRGIICFERNSWNNHQYGIFANGLYGLGNHDLNPFYFTSYGPIRHRSIDVGASYTYLNCYGGSLKIEYAYRLWAQNFPSQCNTIVLTLMIPIGLGI